MNKIKKYYLSGTQSIVILALLFVSGFLYVLPAQKTSAAEPGCYQVTLVPSGDNVITTYTSVNCPDDNTSRGVALEDRCYVARVNVSSQGAQVGTYQRVDCDSFSVGQTTRPQGRASFEPGEDGCDNSEGGELSRDNCGIINYLVILINFLSALAIMAIVASVMFAGYQYMTARDNPGAVAAAKQRIVWALVALGLFVFGYGLLNFLVPGGVL